MLMSTNAYIKYLTQQLVQYLNLTKSERIEHRQQRKEEKTSPISTWFGIVPFAISMFLKKRSKGKQMS